MFAKDAEIKIVISNEVSPPSELAISKGTRYYFEKEKGSTTVSLEVTATDPLEGGKEDMIFSDKLDVNKLVELREAIDLLIRVLQSVALTWEREV